jgi:hypothetical protein
LTHQALRAVRGSCVPVFASGIFLFLVCASSHAGAQQGTLRKDASACQLASSVIAASGYTDLATVNTDTAGTFVLASTGENDPIHIRTLGTGTTRVEIAASAGTSVRILSGGRGRFRSSSGTTTNLSTANTFHERVPTNPVLSLLAECVSPNVRAIDDGLVTQNGVTLRKIELAWTRFPVNPDMIVAQDELKYSKSAFLIDPQQHTVAEIDSSHFAENDSTVPFQYRIVYSGYKAENGHLLPHTIATYINSQLFDTITVLAYEEPSQLDAQLFSLEGLQ